MVALSRANRVSFGGMNRTRRQKHRRLLPWFDLCRCLRRHSNDAFIYYRDRNGLA